MAPRRIHLIAAARPNFMKVAPLWHALAAAPDFAPMIVHTGQHYDAAMSDIFFADLDLPVPAIHLGIGSGSHAAQTGGVMIAYGEALERDRPDWIVVVGDVNSTLACALTGVKLGVRTVHLEAGLRSGDRTMPEEINRIATDQVCDLLWTPSPDADENLAREGIPAARIARVGNIMIDSFERKRGAIDAARMPEALGLSRGAYVVATLHRPSNVDSHASLAGLVGCLAEMAGSAEIVFPVHPRTAASLAAHGLRPALEAAGVRMIEPLPYIRFMSLVSGAAAVVTDSGGIQEETSHLGIPCLTLRDTTERPITLSEGTNRLTDAKKAAALLRDLLSRPSASRPGQIALWDGRTAERCVSDLRARSERPAPIRKGARRDPKSDIRPRSHPVSDGGYPASV